MTKRLNAVWIKGKVVKIRYLSTRQITSEKAT